MKDKEEKRLKEAQAIENQNKVRGKEDFPKTKRLKTPDGTIVYYWDNKLHNWEGPALIPEGNNRLREYYIYGVKYSKEELMVQVIPFSIWEQKQARMELKGL